MPATLTAKELSRALCNAVHTSSFDEALVDKFVASVRASAATLDKVFVDLKALGGKAETQSSATAFSSAQSSGPAPPPSASASTAPTSISGSSGGGGGGGGGAGTGSSGTALSESSAATASAPGVASVSGSSSAAAGTRTANPSAAAAAYSTSPVPLPILLNKCFTEPQMTVFLKYLNALLLEGLHTEKLSFWYTDLLAYIDCKDTALSRLLTDMLLELCRLDESFLSLCVQLYFQTHSKNAASLLTTVEESRALSLMNCLSEYMVLPHSRIAALRLLSQIVRKQGVFAIKAIESPVFHHLMAILKNDCHVVALSTATLVMCMLLCRVTASYMHKFRDLLPVLVRLLHWQQCVLDGPSIQQRQFQQLAHAWSGALSASPSTMSSSSSSSSLSSSSSASAPANTGRDSRESTGEKPSALNRKSGGYDSPVFHLEKESLWIVLHHSPATDPPVHEIVHDSGVELHMLQCISSFLRLLYGLIPCSLLSFLRARYAVVTMDQQLQFEFKELLRPLLIHVGLHPSLVVSLAEEESVFSERDLASMRSPSKSLSATAAVSAPGTSSSTPAGLSIVLGASGSAANASVMSAPASAAPMHDAGSAPLALAKSLKSSNSASNLSMPLTSGAAAGSGLAAGSFQNPPTIAAAAASESAPDPAKPGAKPLSLSLPSSSATSLSKADARRLIEEVSPADFFSGGPLGSVSLSEAGWTLLGEDALVGMHKQENALWRSLFEQHFPSPPADPEEVTAARETLSAPRSPTLPAFGPGAPELRSLSPIPENSKSVAGDANLTSSPSPAVVFQRILSMQLWLANHLHTLQSSSSSASAWSSPGLASVSPSVGKGRKPSVGSSSAVPPPSPSLSASSSTTLVSTNPPSSPGAVSSTHSLAAAPVLPLSVQTLQTQLILVRNELLFERYKRELDEQRTRKLQRDVHRASFVESECRLLQSQVNMQNQEFFRLQQIFEKQRQEYQQNLERQSKWERELQSTLRRNLDDITNLKEANLRLENMLAFSQREITQFREEAERAQTQVQLLGAKLDALQRQVDSQDALKKQIETLSKEVFHRDEEDETRSNLVHLLHEQTKRKMDQMEMSQRHTLLELEMERHYIFLLESKVVELESRVLVAEQMAAARENAMSELRRTFEVARGVAQAQLGSVEEKFAAVRNVNVALENRILDFYAERERLQRSQPFSGKSSRSSSFRTSSGDETGGHTSDMFANPSALQT